MTDREKRTVIVGAVVVAALVVTWGVLRSGGSGEDAGGVDAELYGRLRALSAQAEITQAALARARTQERELRGRLLPGSDPDPAAAELTSLVERVVEVSGLEIDRRFVREAEPVGDVLVAVPLELTVFGDVMGLRLFLYELARSETTLTIRDLRILSAAAPSGVVTPGGAPLHAQLTVVGYVWPAAEAMGS